MNRPKFECNREALDRALETELIPVVAKGILENGFLIAKRGDDLLGFELVDFASNHRSIEPNGVAEQQELIDQIQKSLSEEALHSIRKQNQKRTLEEAIARVRDIYRAIIE